MWMKSTPEPLHCFATDCTTWTTGPQVRDWQNSGVAKVTTNGFFAASAAATVVFRSGTSALGGSAVVIVLGFTPGFSVGLTEAMARSPTEGAFVRFRTVRSPSAWIGYFAPTG